MRDGGYRSTEEIDEWKKRDPIPAFAHRLLEAGHTRQEELDAIAADVTALIAEALQFAHDSPWPDPATVADHVFSQGGGA